ncbi:MAG TPA: hypothetical protein VLB27_08870, partial [candidate division Zixibacteria bacterium]|nr:hypothetical protein [candidate division Zixibacteria bacterium]
MNLPAHTRVFRGAVLGIAFCAALVVSLPARSARAAEQDQFNIYELSVEGWTLASLAGDFNGDNLT